MATVKTSDGAEIFYQVHGSGPTNLIFLHGWGCDGGIWNEMAKHLGCARFRSLCVDLRGHGKSGCADDFSWELLARDVLAVADREKIQRFIPVGFSMGGKLACFLAAKFSERIPALILVAPAAPGTVAIDREFGLRVCREAGDWRRNKEFFQNWFAPATKTELINAYCRTAAQIPQKVLEATVEMTLWTSLADEIGMIHSRTLIIVGEHDAIYGTTYQEKEMLPFLNQATVAMLPSGHFIPMENPAELTKIISRFVSAIE